MAVLADTDESRAIHFNLRHQVYCLEKGFEKPTNSSIIDQEVDSFDKQSVHFLVRDLLTSRWVATLRVVLPVNNDLPIKHVVDESVLERTDVSLSQIAEVSRFTILSEHRHTTSSINELSFSEIMFSLVGAARSYCENIGIKTWVFLCRKSLSKIANRQGMAMGKIGGPYEFKGVRYPYQVDLDKAFIGLKSKSEKLYELFDDNKKPCCYSEYCKTIS